MDFEVHCMSILPTELSLFNCDKVNSVLQSTVPLTIQTTIKNLNFDRKPIFDLFWFIANNEWPRHPMGYCKLPHMFKNIKMNIDIAIFMLNIAISHFVNIVQPQYMVTGESCKLQEQQPLMPLLDFYLQAMKKTKYNLHYLSLFQCQKAFSRFRVHVHGV